MRIALLTDGITPYVTGGMQRHSFHLAKNLMKLGVDLTLIHAIPHGVALPTEREVAELLEAPPGRFRSMALHFPQAKKIPGHYLKESYAFSTEIFELLREEWAEFDFIYSKGFTPWALLEHKTKGMHMAPIGVKFHGYEMFQKSKHLKSRLNQFLLRSPVVYISRNSNQVFSYGGEITEIIRKIGVPDERIAVVGSGIEDSWILGAPIPQSGVRKFLFIGRYERRKGIDDLLKCARSIAGAPIEFHWVGPIPKHKQLDSANAIYHGEIKEGEKLKTLIDACQVLVAPSHAEGMPNVILEAMARGLAIISTKVGAVPMMVSEENGVLIEPRDLKALRRELKRFSEMPEAALSQKRKQSIRKVQTDFRWSAVAQQTLDAIRKITYSNSANFRSIAP